MKLYLNCYVVGEGYTLKRASWPDAPSLEEISRQQLPEGECGIFTGPDAPHLFLGTVDGHRFGCIRNLETGMSDENGRRCFCHIAVEGTEDEIYLIDSVLMYAVAARSRFASMCVKAIEYTNGDYHLIPERFAELLDSAKSYLSQPAPSGILVPENLAEGFFQHSGISSKDIKEVIAFDEWKKREVFPIELFLYCSTPSSGFTLAQINPISGEKMRLGKEAHTCLLPYAQIILNNSGASMALFEQANKVCFLGKGIQSTTTDRYGRKKKMSVVLQAPKSQAHQLKQLAAWALLDYEAFSRQLTDCVSVYDGPRGFEVSGTNIAQLLEQFSRKIVFPVDNRHQQAWNKILSIGNQRPFHYLVTDASLDYFCRVAQINLTENDIEWLISQTEFEQLRNIPANLEFKETLYAKPTQSKADIPPAFEKEKEQPTILRQTDTKSADSKQETKSSPVIQKKEPLKASVPQKTVNQSVGSTVLQEQPKAQQWDSRGDPDEYIDLLKTKWFLPTVAIGIAAVIGAAALWLHFGG